MFFRGLLPRIIIALLIVGLLTAGGVGLYRLGFAQGYQTAVISAPAAGQGSGSNPGQVAPYYGPWAYGPYGYGRIWGPGFGFFPFFPFVGIGFFLLFLFLIGGLFRGWGYRRWGGPGPGYWQHERERGPEEKHEETH